MLDEYIDSQKVVYKILKNAVKNNKYSHAYLFEANGNKEVYNLAISFAKYLLCPNKYSNNKNCGKCTQCNKIDQNIFSDIKIIDADGLWIKKEQIDNLQKEFSTKSVESGKKVYIINNAEKLNVQTSNSILKFLEEPEENIIAILITDNIYQLLDTIISRCQVITLSKNNIQIKEAELNLDITSEEEEKIKSIINEFCIYLEKNKLKTILFTKKLWHDFFKDKKEYIIGMNLLNLYYKDLINIKLGRKIEIYHKYVNEMNEIANINTLNTLIYKMNVIIELKEKIKFNANQALLLDKMIIKLTGGIKNE